jgi:hypothetical protein
VFDADGETSQVGAGRPELFLRCPIAFLKGDFFDHLIDVLDRINDR